MTAGTTEQINQDQADRERFGFLVNPDLTYRRIVFDDDTARETLGGMAGEVVDVAFDQDGNRFHAIFRPDAVQHGAEPNPVASHAMTAFAVNTSHTASWKDAHTSSTEMTRPSRSAASTCRATAVFRPEKEKL